MFLGFLVNVALPLIISSPDLVWLCVFSGPYSIFGIQMIYGTLDLRVRVQAALVWGVFFYLLLHLRTLKSSEARDKKAYSQVPIIQPSFIGRSTPL